MTSCPNPPQSSKIIRVIQKDLGELRMNATHHFGGPWRMKFGRIDDQWCWKLHILYSGRCAHFIWSNWIHELRTLNMNWHKMNRAWRDESWSNVVASKEHNTQINDKFCSLPIRSWYNIQLHLVGTPQRVSKIWGCGTRYRTYTVPLTHRNQYCDSWLYM